jgi:hypothetical protein
MCKFPEKYRRSLRPLIFLAYLFSFITAYPQNQSEQNTITRISSEAIFQLRDNLPVFSKNNLSTLAPTTIPENLPGSNKNLMFYDSLKIKASRTILTKKLYEFVIVTHDTTNKKVIKGTSDASYISHSGKKIRHIEIQRLNVFGVNINDPASTNPRDIENILNKTHFNTNENIIRKNLLISEGDTISPLTLSDNERILRELSFIDDARIMVVPVSDDEADIVVLTKDVYSLGASYTYKGLNRGNISIFERNIFGIGHEVEFNFPYDSKISNSPGVGVHYLVNNMWKSFINLNLFFADGLGKTNYGFSLNRELISSATKYAGGISVMQMNTTEDLDTLPVPEPLKYNLQDYWLSRSFLINKEKVSRIILGIRYTNNNVFDRPYILPDSYYNIQKYRIYLASAAFSVQKYYKTNLIYSYGRTEDIPYGALARVTVGREYNEFNQFHVRKYIGTEIALGKSIDGLGYFYGSAGIASFLNGQQPRQGLLSLKVNYFSNLMTVGKSRMRNFIYLDYTRGFDRNTDEYLVFKKGNGFSGFRNDSVSGRQRLSVSLESVIFSPVNFIGFRFAFFGFTDFSFLSGSNEIIDNGYSLTSIGLGFRIRNDNMVFNTLQVRFSYYPNPPYYSDINHVVVSGEQLLKPKNFDSGPPSIIQFR